MSRVKSFATAALSLASVIILAAATPSWAAAQTGRISGTVTDSARAALPGTQVTVVGTRFTGVTDPSGRFSISGIPAGTYDIRIQRLGQRAQIVNAVVVTSGGDTPLNVSLATVPLSLGGVVVSASRRAEKITDAPATITRIDAAAIQNTVGNSFAPALKEVKGIDFIQVGVTAVAVNARGFNSAFNNRMLMMEDNRIAVLPENGLPVGTFTTTPKVDLAGIEVLVGPGSALYGPDASNGVLTLTTKDPREYPGTTLEVAGGVRNFVDIQGRQAGVIGMGKLGYKLTGEYQQAKDFSNRNLYSPPLTSAPTTPAPELSADWNTDVMRGSGSLVYYMPRLSRLELTGGASKSNGIGQTSVGRNQLVDWQYRVGQLKFTHPNWFAQAYMTKSLSGDTYQLNAYSQNRVRYPSISDDSVKHLSDFPAEGTLMAAELQNTFVVPQLNSLRLTWGGQYRHDIVSSKRQWLIDRQTGEDIKTDQKGVYGQADLPLIPMLRAVVAARYDQHDRYDAQWSPKAALLFTPIQDQTLRVTYNRAFKSPTVLQYGFFFPDFAPFVGVFGNANGYTIKNAAGATVRTIDPIEPERNTTWELGYKGVLGDRLFVDVTGYRSNFKKFMSPLVIIASFLNPASAGGPTFAFDSKTGAQLTGSTGGPQIPLTYFNVGDAQITGTDMGLKFLVTPTIAINGTASLQKLDTVKAKAGDPAEATAFNSPTTKFNVGMDFANIYANRLRGSFTVRYVNGYRFLSGVNNGKIPTFSTFDFTTGYKFPSLGATINLSVQNLFVCRGGTSSINGWVAANKPSLYNKKQECGFGLKHIEMINMPQIGPMAFLGIRWDR